MIEPIIINAGGESIWPFGGSCIHLLPYRGLIAKDVHPSIGRCLREVACVVFRKLPPISTILIGMLHGRDLARKTLGCIALPPRYFESGINRQCLNRCGGVILKSPSLAIRVVLTVRCAAATYRVVVRYFRHGCIRSAGRSNTAEVRGTVSPRNIGFQCGMNDLLVAHNGLRQASP